MPNRSRATAATSRPPSRQPAPTDVNRRETLAEIARAHRELSVEDAELGVLLFTGAAGLVRAVEEHIQRYGLSSGRFAVLLTLLSAPGGQRTPSDLAERLAVSRPTITGIVDGLEKAGVVIRRADRSDARNQPVALTGRGRRLIETIAPDHFRRLADAVRRFTPTERKVLRSSLDLHRRFGELLLEGVRP